jgi:hypothetical protein
METMTIASEAPVRIPPPRSTAERWAVRVFKAAQADGDLKTIADWATFVGVSYSSLCESCRLLGIRPHDARDFMRMLRALIQSRATGCQPEALLDVSDRRTLNRLISRAGFGGRVSVSSIDDYLRGQRFVDGRNEGLAALRRLLNGRMP